MLGVAGSLPPAATHPCACVEPSGLVLRRFRGCRLGAGDTQTPTSFLEVGGEKGWPPSGGAPVAARNIDSGFRSPINLDCAFRLSGPEERLCASSGTGPVPALVAGGVGSTATRLAQSTLEKVKRKKKKETPRGANPTYNTARPECTPHNVHDSHKAADTSSVSPLFQLSDQ